MAWKKGEKEKSEPMARIEEDKNDNEIVRKKNTKRERKKLKKAKEIKRIKRSLNLIYN